MRTVALYVVFFQCIGLGVENPQHITPEGFNVRAVVHDCTGGSFTLANNGDTVVFSNFVDQGLYKQALYVGMAMADLLDMV